MASKKEIFKINDLFDSFDQINAKLTEYTAMTNFSFTSMRSKTLEKLPNFSSTFNTRLIYDEKYYKCSVNPKSTTIDNFKKKNPEYADVEVILCPAVIVFRTTSDKQYLRITQLVLDHDHDSTEKSRIQTYKNKAVGSIIQRKDSTNIENNIEPPMIPVVSTLSDSQAGQSSNVDLSDNDVSLPKTVYGAINYADIINEEDFDSLLTKMQANISLTTYSEEQKEKVLRTKRMLEVFDQLINEPQPKTQTTDSSSTSKLGSLSVHLSRARGRARGRRNRVIGLPAGGRIQEKHTFRQLRESSKKVYILKLMLSDKKIVNEAVVNSIKIKKIDLSHLKLLSIPDALASEEIDIEIIDDYLEIDALNYLKALIKQKRESDYWTCNTCDNPLGTGFSIECDKCLFWNHGSCVNIVKEPENDWCCSKCIAN